jgi:hypothetical protein
MAPLSRTPIKDRTGKVWNSSTDPRNTDDVEWLNIGVTVKPKSPGHSRQRNSLARRQNQHAEWPCDAAGKQPNLHTSEPESHKPGSVNPRKSLCSPWLWACHSFAWS